MASLVTNFPAVGMTTGTPPAVQAAADDWARLSTVPRAKSTKQVMLDADAAAGADAGTADNMVNASPEMFGGGGISGSASRAPQTRAQPSTHHSSYLLSAWPQTPACRPCTFEKQPLGFHSSSRNQTCGCPFCRRRPGARPSLPFDQPPAHRPPPVAWRLTGRQPAALFWRRWPWRPALPGLRF